MIARSPSAVSKPCRPPPELVADKGYDSKALRDWLAERGTTAVIPPRKNRKVQYHYDCSAPGSLDTSLSHAAGLIEIAACHA